MLCGGVGNPRSRATTCESPFAFDPTIDVEPSQLAAIALDPIAPEGAEQGDDDRTQEQIQPGYLEPIDAYNRALVQFDTQLAALSSALKYNDVRLAASSAIAAAGEWIAGVAACTRLTRDIGPTISLSRAARRGLVERGHVLRTLLREADEAFPDSTREHLRSVRESLQLARLSVLAE